LWSYNSSSSDTTISWTVPSVSEGTHAIYFKVTDDAGNTNDTCAYSWSFVYDPSAPAVPVLLTPADLSATCDSTPTFEWTNSSLILAGGSGTDGGTNGVSSMGTPVTYTLQFSPDPFFTAVTTIEGIAESTYTVPDTLALDDITYFWRVEAVDQANNHSGYQGHPFQFEVYIVGDVNGDGLVNLGDVVYLITYLYKGGPAPVPLAAGDVNGNGQVDLGDVVYLITYLYKNGPPPVCEP
jgi:hypothetical protein